MEANPVAPSVSPNASNAAPAEPPGRAASHRFAHIDTLRAVAALMVAWAHFGRQFLPATRDPAEVTFLNEVSRALNFGRLGVLLFFAVSGFVIYASLRGMRAGAGRRFLITRFFRLYPAYWLSLTLGLLIFWWCQGQTFGGYLIFANATMLPRLLHAPLVLGVYWTLETELVFYAFCWALWRAGWLENRRVLVGLIVGLCVAWLVMRGLIGAHVLPPHLPAPWKSMPRHLALMFWGALFRVIYEETAGFRAHLAGNRQVWWLAGLGLGMMLIDGPKGFRVSWHAPVTTPSPYVIAPLLFTLWVAVWRVRWRPLAWLGQISYSFYLFHLLVSMSLVTWLLSPQNAAAWRGWPLGIYMLAGAILTLALSTAIYYAVERPAIALGKHLGGGRSNSPPKIPSLADPDLR